MGFIRLDLAACASGFRLETHVSVHHQHDRDYNRQVDPDTFHHRLSKVQLRNRARRALACAPVHAHQKLLQRSDPNVWITLFSL